jgi:hypothetical protein
LGICATNPDARAPLCISGAKGHAPATRIDQT